MKINVSSGKYTFVQRHVLYIDVLRGGDTWVTDLEASNAINAMMCELDAARVVLAAARQLILETGCDWGPIGQALKKHDALVDDHEQPSEWTK
jgi:hypothetical protein